MVVCLCRTVQTFLGFFDPGPDVDDARPHDPPPCRCPIVPHYGGGLLILARDPPAAPSPPRVLVSSAARRPRPPVPVDPGSRGLRELFYDGGLRMCTEDLGSESGNGGMDVEEMAAAGEACDAAPRCRPRKASSERPRVPPPPPLPWLAAGGHARFMRATRDGGRLRLTEVRIERPAETLRATREGGRLRLDLVVPSDGEEEDEEREETIVVADEEGKGSTFEEEEERAPLLAAEHVVTPTRKGEDRRCQNMVSGNDVPMWWNHHPVMTT